MASVLETTAVSLRKGSHLANMAFSGVLGEVVVDLGNGEDSAAGTDIQTTLRLHNGVTPGGIPMARADMRNVTTRLLAEYRTVLGDKNLAYADLSNMEDLLTNQIAIDNVKALLTKYGMINSTQLSDGLALKANKTLNNVNTAALAEGADKVASGDGLAYANATNIDTTDLATRTATTGSNRALAYADMKNVNTASLATSSGHTGTNLAYVDMSNVSKSTLVNKGLQDSSQLFTGTIVKTDAYDDQKYPTVKSIKNYVDGQYDNFLDIEFNNLGGMSPNDKTASSAGRTKWKINPDLLITQELTGAEAEASLKYVLATWRQVYEFLRANQVRLASTPAKYKTVLSNGTITLNNYSDYYVINSGTIGSFTINSSNITIGKKYKRFKNGSNYRLTEDVAVVVGMPVFDTNFNEIANVSVTAVSADKTQITVSGVVYTYETVVVEDCGVGDFCLYLAPAVNASSATWPSSVHWLDGGEPPPLPTGSPYLLHFRSFDKGANWYGYAEGWATARWD